MTHYQETLNAMAEIEGESWKKYQDNPQSKYNLKKAIDFLQNLSNNKTSYKFQVYGNGGFNRYFVGSDGSV